MNFTIRKATSSDVPAILKLIKDLALYEKAPNEVEVTEKELLEDGFNNPSLFNCFVAEHDTAVVGIALTYLRYSTWKGKALHLEDLIVADAYRNKGLGTLLLDEVVKLGYQLKVRRVSWEVLDWNTNAIAFYEKKGAKILKDWYLVQMDASKIDNYLKQV